MFISDTLKCMLINDNANLREKVSLLERRMNTLMNHLGVKEDYQVARYVIRKLEEGERN